jgi:hypothetical protein
VPGFTIELPDSRKAKTIRKAPDPTGAAHFKTRTHPNRIIPQEPSLFKASDNKKSSPLRRKLALLSVIGLGMASVPVALAAPAQASVTNYACSVTPLKPIFAGHNSSGVKLVDYRIQVRCYSDRYINITQERWEEDDWPNGDDHLGTSYFSRHLNNASGYVTISNIRTLVNGEIGNEEVYHQIRWQEGTGGVWSPYTGWRYSGSTSMSN